MKRIALSITTIIVIAAMVSGATYAVFSDTEEITGNTFAAASFDLELGSPVSLPFNITDLVPGDSGEGKVTLTNNGTIPGNLDVNISNLVESENGCLEPEKEAGDPGVACDAGDLGLVLKMAMFLDLDRDGEYNNQDIELEYSGNTNTTAGLQFAKIRDFEGKEWADDLANPADDNFALDPDDSVDLVIQYQFPIDGYSKPDAIFMTDTMTFDIGFVLNQQ